jgi:hypothetical protein
MKEPWEDRVPPAVGPSSAGPSLDPLMGGEDKGWKAILPLALGLGAGALTGGLGLWARCRHPGWAGGDGLTGQLLGESSDPERFTAPETNVSDNPLVNRLAEMVGDPMNLLAVTSALHGPGLMNKLHGVEEAGQAANLGRTAQPGQVPWGTTAGENGLARALPPSPGLGRGSLPGITPSPLLESLRGRSGLPAIENLSELETQLKGLGTAPLAEGPAESPLMDAILKRREAASNPWNQPLTMGPRTMRDIELPLLPIPKNGLPTTAPFPSPSARYPADAQLRRYFPPEQR